MEAIGDLELPEDFTTRIPPIGLRWLLKYGVSSKIAEHYKFGWSEKLARVILPVFEDGELVFVQSRAVYEKQKPKYLNKRSVGKAFFHSDNGLLIEPFQNKRIITEDILSSVRSGRILPATSTLGTIFPEQLAVWLLNEQIEHVYVWYDGDEAGVNGARKAKKILSLMGVPNTIIKTELDPKEYNNDEIRGIIEAHS